jgi:hypothetical protein
MITLGEYFGPHWDCADRTDDRTVNANDLLLACAALEKEMLAGGVVFPTNPNTNSQVSGQTFGGFRPQSCPQGAPDSAHKEGKAVDRYDPHGEIDAWCMKNEDRLVANGIYIEHPDKTQGWSHWSTRSPKSGRHIFWP